MADISSYVPSFLSETIVKEEPEELDKSIDVADIVIKYEPKYAELMAESSFQNSINNQATLLITHDTNESNANAADYGFNVPLTIKKEENCVLLKIPQLNDFNVNSTERLEPLASNTDLNSESSLCFVKPKIESRDGQYSEEKLDILLASIKNEILADIAPKTDDVNDNRAQDDLSASSKFDPDNIEQISLETKIEMDKKFKLLEDVTLTCSTCSFTTDKRNTLQFHERNHQKASIFKCMYCDQKYPKYALYLHIQAVHAEKKILFRNSLGNENKKLKSANRHKFKCRLCDFSANSSLLLRRHLMQHFQKNSNGVKYSCSQCSYHTEYLLSLKKHKMTHKIYQIKYLRENSSENETKLVATINNGNQCNLAVNEENTTSEKLEKSETPLTITNNTSINQESIALEKCNVNEASLAFSNVPKNNEAVTFKCTKCPFYASRSLVLKRHLKKHWPQNKKNKNRSNFKCFKCSFVTTSIANLQRHLNSHKRLQIFSCNGCNFKSTPEPLKYHQYKCKGYLLKLSKIPKGNQFENTSNTPSSVLNKPSKKHSPQSTKKVYHHNFGCPECSYFSICRSRLERHRQSHKRFQTLSCAACNFKSTPEALKYHQYKCEAYLLKQFECPKDKLSDKGSKTTSIIDSEESDIETEKRLHNFSCPDCSYVTVCASHLKRHQKSHKIFKILSCAGCDFKSTHRSLRSHQKKCKSYLLKRSKEASGNVIKTASITSHETSDHNSNTSLVLPPSRGNEKQVNLGCPECSYTTTSPRRLEGHLKTHKGIETLSCAGCEFKSTPKSLMYHQFKCGAYLLKQAKALTENLHGNTTKTTSIIDEISDANEMAPKKSLPPSQKNKKRPNFSCPECSYVTIRLSALEIHQETHKRFNIASCSGCGYKSTPIALKYHKFNCDACPQFKKMKKKSNSSANEKNKRLPKYDCPECSFVATSLGTLKQHQATHKVFETFSCPGCGFRCTPRSLRLHENKCNACPQNQKMKYRSEFNCPECSYVTTRLSTLEIHQETHKRFNIMSCPGCSYKSTPMALKYHKYNCDACPEIKKKEIRSNSSANEKNKRLPKYSCSECSFVGMSLGRLKQHQETHKIFETFSCPGCGFRCTPKSLRHHENKCDACPQNQKIKYRSEFRCSECSYVTTYVRRLERHQRSHKVGKNLSCDGCGFKSTPKSLTFHQFKCEPYLLKQSSDLII